MTTRTWGGYARISEDPNDLRTGVGRQVEDIADGITKLGGTPPAPESEHLHVENDTSAYKKRRVTITDHYGETRDAWRVVRPKWAAALRALRARQITALMVYDLDRLARDPYDLEDAIEVVERYGALIVSATASDIDLTTDHGRMAARLHILMANKSSADTARRVARAHLAAARDGKPVGGNRPFGFQADKTTHDPVEAELIRQAAATLLAGGTLRQITDAWQSAGVSTVRGKPWRAQTVRQTLKGPRLAGWRVHQGKVAVDKQGEPVRLRDAAGELVAPILDQGTFDAVQAILSRPDDRKRVPQRGARHYMLTGLIRCGVCNGPMYGNAYGQHQGEPRYYYVCQGASDDKHAVSISGHGTDAAIEQLVLARLASEDFDTPPPEFTGAERLEVVKRKIREYADQFNRDEISGAVYFPEVSRLEAERDELVDQRDRLMVATLGPRLAQLTPEAWAGFDTGEKRAHLELMLDAVLIRPAKQRQNRLDIGRIVPVWHES